MPIAAWRLLAAKNPNVFGKIVNLYRGGSSVFSIQRQLSKLGFGLVKRKTVIAPIVQAYRVSLIRLNCPIQ